MKNGQTLEKLLGTFVNVEHPKLEVEHRLTRHTKQKMPRLNNSGMHRPDRHLEYTFPLHLPEPVPHSGEGRQLRVQVKILAQRVNLWPVIVQYTPTRIGMPN